MECYIRKELGKLFIPHSTFQRIRKAMWLIWNLVTRQGQNGSWSNTKTSVHSVTPVHPLHEAGGHFLFLIAHKEAHTESHPQSRSRAGQASPVPHRSVMAEDMWVGGESPAPCSTPDPWRADQGSHELQLCPLPSMVRSWRVASTSQASPRTSPPPQKHFQGDGASCPTYH